MPAGPQARPVARLGSVGDEWSLLRAGEVSAHAAARTLKTGGTPMATSRACRSRGADNSPDAGGPSGSSAHTSRGRGKQRQGGHEPSSDDSDAAASGALKAPDAAQDGRPADHSSSVEPLVLKRRDVASKSLLVEQSGAPRICHGGRERRSMAHQEMCTSRLATLK